MDLTPSEEQAAIIDLAGQIVRDHTGGERLRVLERAGSQHDTDLWAALYSADLVGLAIPTSMAGGGYGLVEAGMVCEAVGRGPAAVAMVETVASARALARAGDEDSAALAASIASTGSIVVPALREGPTAVEMTSPEVRASEVGDEWLLSGTKRLMSGVGAAEAYLVSAHEGSSPGLFVVRADACEPTDSVSTTGVVLRSISLDGTAARRVPFADGHEALAILLHELRVLRCAQLAGVAAGALELAAGHATEREQFGSPIGSFQAVAHRLADSWLDVNLMQATARQAAWRTDKALPSTQAALSAALWATEGGQRVVHAAQHIHGGIGVDLDYPVHRFFRVAKELELALGGAGFTAAALGQALANEPLSIG